MKLETDAEGGLRPEPRTPAARILVVDDDEDLVEVMTIALSGVGHDVDAARNGFAALERLEAKPYDLVISDLDMPGLDGPGLYLEMTRRWPASAPRVLFVSGFADTAEYVGFLNATNVPVLVKPFDLDDLRQLVGRQLEKP
jgi:DNA-binding response OmpR family regulator